jgi:hypothetical protein
MKDINRETAARYVLAISVRYGKTGIGEFLGTDVLSLVQLTLSELHKNNLPEEYFLFALISRMNRKVDSLPAKPGIDRDVAIEAILTELTASPEFEANPRADEIDGFRRKSVLEDFTYYLSKMFFYEREIGDRVVETISEMN